MITRRRHRRPRRRSRKLLGRPAHLRLHVKVAPDWTSSPADIARLGYRKDGRE